MKPDRMRADAQNATDILVGFAQPFPAKAAGLARRQTDKAFALTHADRPKGGGMKIPRHNDEIAPQIFLQLAPFSGRALRGDSKKREFAMSTKERHGKTIRANIKLRASPKSFRTIGLLRSI